MKRNIISIDESLCNGCGACVEGCHEGALQLIDGKARIVSELYCDGLGACIGECPVDAITIEKREAEPYDEVAVMQRIAPKGEKTILAHLNHLKDHNEMTYLRQGLDYIEREGLTVDVSSLVGESPKVVRSGCPGSQSRVLASQPKAQFRVASEGDTPSALSHWPVQLHLINPQAGFFADADVVLASDCSAFAYADFHGQLLQGKRLVIACPKFDHNQEVYVEKLRTMIESTHINSLTVVIMEVPCCGGLMRLAMKAIEESQRKIPVKRVVVSVDGKIKSNEWVAMP